MNTKEGRQTDAKTKQTNRQTGRQTDRQAGPQADIETYRLDLNWIFEALQQLKKRISSFLRLL